MKYIKIAGSLLLLTMLLGSCHKTCTCTRYDGAIVSYSADEVDDRGTTCANMVFQSGVRYYSICEWD